MFIKADSSEFFHYLLNGQKVEWQYSLVTLLVIVGLISTPLILGSIKNRTYTSLKQEVETINNALQISVEKNSDSAKVRLNNSFLEKLKKNNFIGYGNREFYMRVKGPSGALLANVVTLNHSDPLIKVYNVSWLDEEQRRKQALNDNQVLIPDRIGYKFFGSKSWDKIKAGDKAISRIVDLEINDRQLSQEFEVVGHFTGRKVIFINPSVSREIFLFTVGLGSKKLGLSADPELSALSLPKLSTKSCILVLPNDGICSKSQRDLLQRRLDDLSFSVEKLNIFQFLDKGEFTQFKVTNTSEKGLRGEYDCKQNIHINANRYCKNSLVYNHITGSVDVRNISDKTIEKIQLVGVDADLYNHHGLRDVGLQKMNITSLSREGIIDVRTSKTQVTKNYELIELAGEKFKFTQTQDYQSCSEDCNFYVEKNALNNLINLQDGSVDIVSSDNQSKYAFRRVTKDEDYEEVYVYSSQIEVVESDAKKLSELLGSDYRVDFNLTAIRKLKSSNSKMETLFQLTMSFSMVFLLLSLSALSKITISRRNRQVAQMLILGYPKNFVKRLIVGEYVILTIVGTLLAAIFSWLLCIALRIYLVNELDSLSGRDESFRRVIESLTIDLSALLNTGLLVFITTVIVGFVTASISVRVDPVQLLN
jgi:hypothetical protein